MQESQESIGNMQESNSTQPVAAAGGDLWFQRILAVPIAFGVLYILLLGVVALVQLIQGDFRAFLGLLFLAMIGTATGSLSISLFRGRGVPWLVFRALTLSCALAVVVFFAAIIWETFNGQLALRDLLGFIASMALSSTMFLMPNFFKVVWHNK
jgi:hypothetical protein